MDRKGIHSEKWAAPDGYQISETCDAMNKAWLNNETIALLFNFCPYLKLFWSFKVPDGSPYAKKNAFSALIQ